jgi:hypothetical protein
MMHQVWGQPLQVCESHDYLLYLVAPQASNKAAALLAQMSAVVVVSAKPHPQLGQILMHCLYYGLHPGIFGQWPLADFLLWDLFDCQVEARKQKGFEVHRCSEYCQSLGRKDKQMTAVLDHGLLFLLFGGENVCLKTLLVH